MTVQTIGNIDYAKNGNDYNNIVLRGDFNYRESDASVVIMPGSLVVFDGAGNIAKHGVQNGAGVNKAFALEDSLQGKTIRDAYAIDDLARWATLRSGDQVLAILLDDTTANGALLGSNGDGTLKVHSTGDVIGQQLYKYTDTAGTVRAIIQVF